MMAEDNSDDDISSLGLTATTSTLDTATEKLILENIMAENDDDDEEEDAELAALLNTSSDIDIDDDDNINVVSSSQRRVQKATTKVTTAIADDAFSSSSEEEEFNDDITNDGGGTTAAATTPRFSNRGAVNNYTIQDNDTENNTTTTPHSIYPSQQPQQHQQDFSWVSSADDDTVDASNTMRGPQPSLSMRISEDTIDIVEGDNVGGNDNNIIDNNGVSVSTGTNTTNSSNNSTTATKQPMGSVAALKLPLQSTTPTPPPHCSSPFDQALHEVKKRGGGHHSRTNSFTFESPTASTTAGNTNAFTFENTTPPAAAATNASSTDAVAPVATTLSSSPGATPVAAVAAAMLANSPYVDLNVNQHDEHHNDDNNDEDHDDDDSYDDKEENDDDGSSTNNDTFFAKADNMAVDEILYAASGEVEVEEERGTEKQHVVQQQQQRQQQNASAASSADVTHATEGEEDNMGFQSLNIVNISTEDEGGVEVYSPSQSAMHSTTDPSSTGGGGNSKSANSSAATVGGKTTTTTTTTTTTSGGTTIKATNTTSNNNMMQMIQNTTTATTTLQKYYKNEEERESMRRSFQQSISAAVLVSLAHKRYERRRLAAMEIEKVVRSYVMTEDYPRVRAILLLLSDDYVRSTNEDARKGGAVALAACAIGLKKANEGRRDVIECRDLILASVVHACQDHSQRVRYYATESLFNVTKVIPSLAVRHFFILFEILRSLYADVDLDVRSGAELLDKKLKEVIVGAINSGSFSADACVPVFARFVYMRNKATKQLTLTWLQEFSEKLVGDPILEFLHLFLGGIFAMIADPNATI
eukprot:scaffold27751_cov93-Skeletonema_marinoi.AAC.2